MPAILGIDPAAERRTERAAGEEQGEVQAVQAAADLGAEGEQRALAQHQVGGDRGVEHDGGHGQQAERQRLRMGSEQWQQEAQRADRQRDRGGAQGMAGIGQAAGDRRGHRAGHADQGEQRDPVLAQAEVGAGQGLRRHGPEQAEGAEQAGVVQRPAPQDRGVGQHRPQRGDQRAVALGGGRPALRQLEVQHHGQQQHQRRGDPEHGLPAAEAGQHAGHRPRHHNPQQQAADHLANGLAARRFRRQVGRERHQHLGHHGAQPDRQRRQQELPGRVGVRGQRQRGAGGDQAAHDQAPVLEQVAQRHDEQQAEAVADLGEGDHQAGGARRHAEGGPDRADQRLGVIQVGDDDAGGGGQQQRHAARYLCLGACSHGVLRVGVLNDSILGSREAKIISA